MPRKGCPDWEYDRKPRFDRVLKAKNRNLLDGIQRGSYPARAFCGDLRPIHADFFSSLVPPGYDYYAGCYRGERDCLIGYEVTIGSDPRVGIPSAIVVNTMQRFGPALLKHLENLDSQIGQVTVLHDPRYRAVATVKFCGHAFVTFLTYHPFADGNGHCARALLWILLAHFGYVAPNWSIHPRPGFATYSDMIAAHRSGNHDPLEQHILGSISAIA